MALELIAASPDDGALGFAAAAPLEELLALEEGLEYLDVAREEFEVNPRFRRALAGVWNLPDELQELIDSDR